MLFLALPLLIAPGRPLFYWGARAPVIVADAPAVPGVEAQVSEVHAVLDKGDLVLRFTFDRPVTSAMYLEGGAPVSGRLRVVLYIDTDGDRATGVTGAEGDLVRGADHRLEIGVVAVGKDEEENLPAEALVIVSVASLSPEGKRHGIWRIDDSSPLLSIHGEWLELRVPLDKVPAHPGTRLILAMGEKAYDGRLKP
jgi:hypothetical protein